MNRSLLSVFPLLIFFNYVGFLNAQNIITVSSSSGFAADFTNLQEAIDSAFAGDIILLHGGIYENSLSNRITLTKRLQIYGTGYFLTENPQTQSNPVPATINSSMYFEAGSAGSIIAGLNISSFVYVRENNISLIRCYAEFGLNFSNTRPNNTLIQQCYLGGIIYASTSSDISGIIIRNSFIDGYIGPIKNSIIENNIIAGVQGSCSSTPENTVFNNNIFTYTDSDPLPNCSFNLNIFKNNLFVRNDDSPLDYNGGNNQINVALTDLFVGAGQGTSTDGQWLLKANSPALGAGVNGVDCGIFGGPIPYVLSGIPAGPHIFELTADPVGTTTGGLNVTIKAKIQN